MGISHGIVHVSWEIGVDLIARKSNACSGSRSKKDSLVTQTVFTPNSALSSSFWKILIVYLEIIHDPHHAKSNVRFMKARELSGGPIRALRFTIKPWPAICWQICIGAACRYLRTSPRLDSHRRAPHTWACTSYIGAHSYIGMHLIYSCASVPHMSV
jgi:hypothetical protein